MTLGEPLMSSSASLIGSKLFIPPVRMNLVRRPHLMDRLDEGLERKLTLISAPAGFGKTTAVCAWLDRLQAEDSGKNGAQTRISWISLDASDNDSERFLAHLIAALRTAVAGHEPLHLLAEGFLGSLQSPQPPRTEAVLATIINEVSHITCTILLVLDDYHLIDAEPIHDAVAFMLQHMPPQMHLVIASREDPLLPISRLRVQNQLTEIRAVDLRFNNSEAAEFLNQVMGLELSVEDIAELEIRTEGWIAGLQLAAISLQGHKDPSGLIKSFSGSHRYVLDYLLEEVLEQQTKSIQEFLLQTSILNRLTGALCDALTGHDDGRETLAGLEHANLFVVPLDEERKWYRYHHLFSDLLRQRLRRTRSDLERKLHFQASEWYAQNGYTDGAIEHALLAADYDRAADLIEEHIEHVLHYGEHHKLRRWLDEVPADITFSKPHLCILLSGNLFISGQIDEAERYLQAAEMILDRKVAIGSDKVPDGEDRFTRISENKLRGRAATVRSFLVSYRGDSERALQYAQKALDHLPESDVTWQCSAFDSLGSAYSANGDTASAYQARLDALATSKKTGNDYMILFANLRLVVTLRDLGHLQQALDICQQQVQLANKSGLSHTALVGWLNTLWAEILAERNELDRALELAKTGVDLTEQGNDVVLLGSSYLGLMRVLYARDDMAEALKYIRVVAECAPKDGLSPWIANQLAAWQARIWVAQGEVDAACRWAETSGLDIDGELRPVHDFDYVVFARLLLAQGKIKDAKRLLQRLLDGAEAGGRFSKIIEIKILQALAWQAGGELVRARALLDEALALGEPEGFFRIFIDEGEPMASLLNRALSRSAASAYIRHLMTAFDRDGVIPSRKSAPAINQSALVEPLSERELEVIHHIAQGLTNREIADRLYLSLNTVKVHTRNIYGKLNVHSRVQAIARSRELGLLEAGSITIRQLGQD